LWGKAADRPPVSFYEIGAYNYDSDDPNTYNVHNDPSWRPLIELAEEQTDIMRVFTPRENRSVDAALGECLQTETWKECGRRFVRPTVTIGKRRLSSLVRRDAVVDTHWTLEHLLKNVADLELFLDLSDEALAWRSDARGIESDDAQLGEAGIVTLDIADPLC
jgi:hypothetical protein